MYMRFLLETVRLSVDSTNMYGETALYKAYENGLDDLIFLLYDHGANPFILTGTGANLLHAVAAATGDRVEAIKGLIRRFRDDGTLATALNVKHRYVPGEDYYIVTGMDKGRAAWHYIHWHRLLRFAPSNKVGTLPNETVQLEKYGSIIRTGWGLAPSPALERQMTRDRQCVRLDTTYPLDRTPIPIAIYKKIKR
jgi:hypothetical protein